MEQIQLPTNRTCFLLELTGTNMNAAPNHHCWECRRRYLVCDSHKPGCRRCITSGTQCPGYGEVKPTRLRWVEPGRVVARGRGGIRRVSEQKPTRQLPETSNRPAVDMACTSIQPGWNDARFVADAHILVQAVDYCKSHPNFLFVRHVTLTP